MKQLLTFEHFVDIINESAQSSSQKSQKYRMQKLSGIEIEDLENKYSILISIGEYDGKSLITEHEKYQGFQKTTNRYIKHPENLDIPVSAHYHVYPNNGKIEIYAVNMDGTAHHKKHSGYEVPNKEAKELKKLGVNIPLNRIIEKRQIDFSLIELDQILLLIE